MFSKKTLVMDDKQVSYFDQGDKSRPAVLLLHGFPESSMMWKNVIPAIESCGFRAIAPDFPGFGQSEMFEKTATWEHYMDFVTDFLKELNIEKAHLVLHDFGVLIGLRWACENTDKVLSLIVSDAPYSPEYEWHEYAKKLRTVGEGEETISQVTKEFWTATMKRIIPGVTEEVLNDFYMVYENKRVPLELYRSGDLEKLKPYQGKLKQISGPVTIIWGENDPFVSTDYAYKLRDEELPQANVNIILNAGHFIYVEAPERTAHAVKEHFSKVSVAI